MGKQSTRENKTIYQLCREAQGLTREKARLRSQSSKPTGSALFFFYFIL